MSADFHQAERIRDLLAAGGGDVRDEDLKHFESVVSSGGGMCVDIESLGSLNSVLDGRIRVTLEDRVRAFYPGAV